MKHLSLVASLGLIGALVAASSLLLVSVTACDPTAQEMAVRMRMQQFINMFPSIYDDIRAGRLVPNRPGWQQGQLNNQGQFVNPNQGQLVNPNGGQMTVLPNGQMVIPQGQFVNPNGQVVVPQQQTVLPNGQVVIPQGQTVIPNNG